MTTASLTAADLTVRNAVTRQLEWDPKINADAIGVAAQGGTVTLTGYIDTYAGKLAAERAAVATWQQRDCAERAAANAPGLARVDNRITVEPSYRSAEDDLDDLC